MKQILVMQFSSSWLVNEIGNGYAGGNHFKTLADAKAEAVRLACGENARVKILLRSYAVDYHYPPDLDEVFPGAVKDLITYPPSHGRDDYRIAYLSSTGRGAVGLA
jgi:hypothetical protein